MHFTNYHVRFFFLDDVTGFEITYLLEVRNYKCFLSSQLLAPMNCYSDQEKTYWKFCSPIILSLGLPSCYMVIFM